MQRPRFLTRPALWFGLVTLWAVVLWCLSAQSHLPSPVEFEGIDKLEHAAYFAIGGACFLLALRCAGWGRRPSVVIVMTVLFCSMIGALDEWHQTFTPGRSGGDVWDWTADTLGALLGAFCAQAVYRRLTSAGTTTAAAP